MALKITPPSKPGAAILPPKEIAPLWQRITVVILGVLSFPLAAFVLGIVLAVFWRLFRLGFDYGATLF